MSHQLAIQSIGLTFRYGKTIAVHELSLEIQRGEIFGLLGHNGAGKTTTVRLLNGLLRPDCGHARVLDFDPVNEGTPLRRLTGVLTENPSLYERLNARQNLELYAALYGLPVVEVRPESICCSTSFNCATVIGRRSPDTARA